MLAIAIALILECVIDIVFHSRFDSHPTRLKSRISQPRSEIREPGSLSLRLIASPSFAAGPESKASLLIASWPLNFRLLWLVGCFGEASRHTKASAAQQQQQLDYTRLRYYHITSSERVKDNAKITENFHFHFSAHLSAEANLCCSSLPSRWLAFISFFSAPR